MPQQQQAPPPTAELAPSQITISGLPLSSPSSVLRGFRAQRQELGDQLSNLQDTREGLSRELLQLPAGDAGRAGIEARIATIDARIAGIDKQIAEADAQVAKAAAVPGAVVDPPRFVREGPPEEVFVLGGLFIVVVLLPLSIAYARRIWRRGATVVQSFPKEIAERLGRLEQAAEATALEVERIGEGQRFLTRLFTEGPQAHVLSAGTSSGASVTERQRE
jgi:hypothetical protein